MAACAILLAGCSTTSPTPAQQDARGQLEVLAAMQRYSDVLKKGPVEAAASFYTVDAELLEPGMATIHGRDAIKDFLAPMFTDYEVTAATMETEALDVHGPAAYQWGNFKQRIGPRGKLATEYHGRYVATWRHEGDGQWRMARLLVQPSPPAEPTAP